MMCRGSVGHTDTRKSREGPDFAALCHSVSRVRTCLRVSRSERFFEYSSLSSCVACAVDQSESLQCQGWYERGFEIYIDMRGERGELPPPRPLRRGGRFSVYLYVKPYVTTYEWRLDRTGRGVRGGNTEVWDFASRFA